MQLCPATVPDFVTAQRALLEASSACLQKTLRKLDATQQSSMALSPLSNEPAIKCVLGKPLTPVTCSTQALDCRRVGIDEILSADEVDLNQLRLASFHGM